MTQALLLPLALLISVCLGSTGLRADELPMKPEPNYSIWLNINEAVIEIERINSGDAKRIAELSEMRSESFYDKTPRDVMVSVVDFSAKIDQLRKGFGSELTPIGLNTNFAAVSPGTVYRLSSGVLTSMAEYLVCVGGNDTKIARFFERRRYPDITPNDVFNIVDLATRRLDNVLARSAPESTTVKECS